MEELSKPENRKKINDKMYCNEHSGMILKVYCKTCDQLICRDCMDFKHVKQGHSCVLVKDVANNYKELLASNNRAMEDVLTEGNALLQRLMLTTEQLDRDAENIKSQIVQKNDIVLKTVAGILEQKTKTLLNKVDEIRKAGRAKLDRKTEETKLYIKNVKTSVQLSKTLVDQGTEEEIVSSQKMMLDNANNLLIKRQEYFKAPIPVNKLSYTVCGRKEPTNKEILRELANRLGEVNNDNYAGGPLKIDGTELSVEQWTASTHASPERVSNAWLADGSVLHNSTHRKYRSRNENKWLRKGARQKKINTCRGLTPGQATTLKSPFNETKVKLNDDLVKKMHKKAELKEIVEKGEVKLDTKGGYLTGTWNAIHAVGQRLISILSGSDQTENNYDTANNFTFSSTINDQPGASPEAIDPSTVTDQPAGTLSTPQSKQPDESFTVSLLFLRYIMAYHYEVFLKLESVCKEISFEVKSKTERNLKLTPREDVDPNKFSKAVNKFIDFYQVQNQKMLQQDIAKLPKDKMDVLSEARTKFSVVIDSAQELDKITIYGEKDNVEEAYRFFQSKVGVLNPGPGSSSSSKGKTANVALSETFSSDLSENLKLVVYQGDLTKENVDAIVNPANDHLQHGGGAAGAIVKAGGRSIQDESDDIMRKRGKRPLQPGEVELTAGGRLPCKFVVHAVGPVWNRHPPNTAMQLLANAVFNSLCLACRNGARSISIPAIGSGLYQVPVDVCARVLFETVVHFASKADKSSSLEEIHFVNIDSSTNRKFVQEMEKRFHGSLKREKVETSLSHNTKEQERQTQIGQQRMAFTTTKSETNSDRGRTTNVTHRGSNHNNHIGDNKGTGARPPDDKPLLLSYAGAAAGKNTDTDHDSKPGADNKTSKYDECSICLSGFTKKKSLDKCGHSFCTKCIDKAFEVKKQCPICSMVYGPLTGNQPKGNMYDSFQSTSLPGFKSCGTIVISYRFPSGIQCQDHPHPGKPYTGTSRTAYLPDNKEGRKVLKLLQKAFQQKLTFTIGRSTTTGRDDCVTWNDIHHKTSEYGGSTGYGYPDPDYLKRVKDELAAKGIRE